MQLQVGVKVLLMNQDEAILLLRRAVPISDGTIVWDIPGGRINAGESIEEALAREVLEETGITLGDERTLIDAQDILPSNETHVVRLTYVCRINSYEVTVSNEHDTFMWAKRDEFTTLPLDPYVVNSIRQAHILNLLR